MKEQLFVDAARVLIGTQEAIPRKVTPAKARLLREVTDILDMARQVSQAAGRPASDRAWHRYWQKVVKVQVTIKSVAQGQRPAGKAIAHAADLCVRIFDARRAQ